MPKRPVLKINETCMLKKNDNHSRFNNHHSWVDLVYEHSMSTRTVTLKVKIVYLQAPKTRRKESGLNNLDSKLPTGLSKYLHRAWLGCHARWGSFFWPSPFWSLGDFFFGFFLLNLSSAAPNYSRKPPMRSSKAPPKQKNRGRFYPTPATPSRTWPPSHARWGFLGTSVANPLVLIICFVSCETDMGYFRK